jgi:hypothetical protein
MIVVYRKFMTLGGPAGTSRPIRTRAARGFTVVRRLSGWLFLAVAVAFSTILWPVARWGLSGDAKPATAGFWTSVAMGGSR